jgi:sec-independent protein translocase protein TatA
VPLDKGGNKVSINGVEWLLIFVVALILFGPKKLPELGRALGKSLREFKKATSGVLSEEDSGQGAEAKPDAPKAEIAKTGNPKAETQTVKDETKTPNL